MMVPLVSAVGEIFIAQQLSDLQHEANAAYELLVIVIDGLREAIFGGLLFHAALVSGIGLAFLVGGWLASRRTSSIPLGQPGSGMGAVVISEDVSPPQPVSPPPPVFPVPEDETVKEDEG
jgi:hypothetical protein